MNRLRVIVGAFVAAASLSPGSVLADTWGEPIDTPGARFVVLSSYQNQAVLDQETGLVWERAPSSSTDVWSESHIDCNTKVVGNRMGWRLPTIQELASLIDPAASGVKLSKGHPFSNIGTDRSVLYWSATSRIGNAAWIVSFYFPLVDAVTQSVEARAWCVRGGQGVNPQ